jgi:hypothetical protein
MADQPPQPEKRKPDPRNGRRSSKDISPILKGWDYEPGAINVRKIIGADGRPKLQMRLDLGILQMEMTGRPDGQRPHGCESLLDYFEGELQRYRDDNGTDLGFHLTPDQCQSLREEAVMYYHRYLSLFVLEDYPAVVRDTDRNLRLLDLCGQFAVEEHDRLILEQYRPYIIMINTRARASIAARQNDWNNALHEVTEGLNAIRRFFRQFGHENMYRKSYEVRVLKKFARDIRRKIPVDPVVRLQARLDKAIREERYEDAARLRDQIAATRFPGPRA